METTSCAVQGARTFLCPRILKFSEAEDELENVTAQLATALSRQDDLEKQLKDQDTLIRKLRGNYETESALLVGQLQARIEYLENEIWREV